MRFGALLPHFGKTAEGHSLIECAQLAESLGFDSLWVRDHVAFVPRPGVEHSESARFFESLTVLTAVGAATRSIRLGTAALTPFRHPLHTALVASTMTHFIGPRLIVGVGGGSSDREFAAVGLSAISRTERTEQSISVMRSLWAGRETSWHGELGDADGLTLEPGPSGEIPIWWCGTSPRAARLAATLCDGWLPGRITLETLHVRVLALEEAADKANRTRPTVGIMPMTIVTEDRQLALKRLGVDSLLRVAETMRFVVPPRSGAFSTIDDLKGMTLWGSPTDIASQCMELDEAGVDLVIFDLRLDFERWSEQIEMLGEEVMKHQKMAQTREFK